MKGNHRIWTLATLGMFILAGTASAFETVRISNFQPHQLDKTYPITGAYGSKSDFYTVSRNSSLISKITPANSKSTLVAYTDVSKLSGLYSAFTKRNGENFDFQAISVCQKEKTLPIFYVVNGFTGEILKIQDKSLERVAVDYEKFPDYKYEDGNDGFRGLTVDCKNDKLFVAKEKNPNIVYTIDLKTKTVEHEHNLSTGEEKAEDISDLFYFNNQLYVLQKNISSVLVMNPNKPGTTSFVRRYDYSQAKTKTPIKNSSGYKNAEGLVVFEKSIYLFLDSKDVIVELKI